MHTIPLVSQSKHSDIALKQILTYSDYELIITLILAFETFWFHERRSPTYTHKIYADGDHTVFFRIIRNNFFWGQSFGNLPFGKNGIFGIGSKIQKPTICLSIFEFRRISHQQLCYNENNVEFSLECPALTLKYINQALNTCREEKKAKIIK